MFEKLEPRERLFVYGGIVVAVVLVVFLLGGALRRARQNVSARVQESRSSAESMVQLRRQILSMQAANPLPEQSAFSQTISTELEKNNLNANSFQESPPQTQNGQTSYGVSVRLVAVRLEDVIRFLHGIEYPRELPAPVVENLKLTRSVSGREVYDVSMSITLTGAAR